MSVQLIQGDLLDWSAGPYSWNVLAHCVNAQGVMGSGIALAIKERYSAAYDVYHEAHKNRELQLGTFTVATVGDKKIVNLCGQQYYGSDGTRCLDYEAFYSGLSVLRDSLEAAHVEGRVYSLGLPYNIGCQRAGGSWRVIETMIRDLLDNSPITCYIVQKS